MDILKKIKNIPWRQPFYWGTITGLFLPGSAEENGFQKSGRSGIIKAHGKTGIKQVLEWYDGILGFAKTKPYFEQKKID